MNKTIYISGPISDPATGLPRDRATVYWKQSVRDFIGGTPAHRLFTDDELHKIFDDYPNAVGKEWSMFNSKKLS